MSTTMDEEKTDSELRQEQLSRRVTGLRGLAGMLAHANGSNATLDEQDAFWLLYDGLKDLEQEINR